MRIHCDWFPDVRDIGDVLYYWRFYRTVGKEDYWRCEAYGTLITIVGVVLMLTLGITQIALLDPSDAFMASSVVKTTLCVNLTCGAHYCSFTQPTQCKATPIHLEKNEVAEFCSTGEACTWSAEVLSDSGYENRSASVYIFNTDTGQRNYFPLLDEMKRQFLGITKYINTQSGVSLVSWAIAPSTLSEKMTSCGAGLPAAVKQNTRCGGYNIYLDDKVYETAMMQRYTLEMVKWLILVFTGVVALITVMGWLLGVYRSAGVLEKKMVRPHQD